VNPALVDPEAVAGFLDAHGIGSGPVSAERIGDGRSNITVLLERGRARLVLRRPPPPPLPPSAHDMLREARLQIALAGAGVRVPRVLAVCEDESVLGVPFYVMEYLEGTVVTNRVPPGLDSPEKRRRLGLELVDALVELHAVDLASTGLAGFGKVTGYLERQVRRFSGLWELNATRELPAVTELGAWLDAQRPESGEATIVHGDYRLGNLLVSLDAPARVVAILDWELATIGDPLADLGYLVATYSDADSPGGAMELSPATREPGFPSRSELVERYADRSGRPVGSLPWYEALALWKAAVFCEALHGRYLRGERGDAWAASLAEGVPRLLELAEGAAARA
jgi:aminoglycoside phosphotransferase (APT) family kinase protein